MMLQQKQRDEVADPMAQFQLKISINPAALTRPPTHSLSSLSPLIIPDRLEIVYCSLYFNA